MLMTLSIRLASCVLLGLALSSPLAAAEQEAATPKLLTVLTSDANETQAMALILTTQYARIGGEAQVLLCDAAGELGVTDSLMGSMVVQPAGRSPRQMLQGMIEAGVKVEVCAIFLPGRGLDAADLVDGVGVAQPPAIAALMANPDWRLFTF
jgi:predicted peroxiredoxin